MSPGTVYLVGAGPGAADLLTLRAARLLARADILFHDALVAEEVLALAGRARRVAVGKRGGQPSAAQRFINKRLVDAARTHEVVVRLKGGDPMLFGRAQEEIDALSRAGIPCEVVPGVSAAFAASAELGISLTKRGVSRSVSFLTPRAGEGERPADWLASALAADTAIFYMGAGQAQTLASGLIANGKPRETPVAVVVNASLPGSRVFAGSLVDLPRLARQADGPALILVGELYAGCRSERREIRLSSAG